MIVDAAPPVAGLPGGIGSRVVGHRTWLLVSALLLPPHKVAMHDAAVCSALQIDLGFAMDELHSNSRDLRDHGQQALPTTLVRTSKDHS